MKPCSLEYIPTELWLPSATRTLRTCSCISWRGGGEGGAVRHEESYAIEFPKEVFKNMEMFEIDF